jgi:sarcosine oxidase
MAGNYFDVIVLGVGSMGSAACYYLARHGLRVLGLEQFSIPNELSSHIGQSRLIRKAYYEHPGYVPLLQRAYDNWKHLETIIGEQVYFETGLLYCGMPEHPVMKGIHLSANEYNLRLDKISERQMVQQFAAFNIPSAYEKILEPGAGFITPGKAIQLYAKKALENNAVIISNIRVNRWKKTKDGFEVQSTNGNYYAKKLVVTTGAWSRSMLPSLSTSLTVTRQALAWMEVNNPSRYALNKFPCWIIAEEGIPGIWYGFPILPGDSFEGPVGFKLAYHFPGQVTDPGTINRLPSAQDEGALIRVMNDYFPGAYKSTLAMKICMYTNTPDEHFIIDYLPGYDKNVIIATGFSGHGFKFASAVGEIIFDLTVSGTTSMPIGFLKADRFK